MPGVNPPPPDLRIMRIDAPKHQLIPQPRQRLAHPIAEKTRAWPEEFGRRWGHANGGVGGEDDLLDGMDLVDEGSVGEGAGGRIVHGMVGELVAVADEVVEEGFVAWDLGADDEEGGCCVVCVEDVENGRGLGGGGVVNGKGDEGSGGGDLEEDVGPARLEEVEEPGGRFVDEVEGDEDKEEEEEEEHPGVEGKAGEATEEGAKERERGHVDFEVIGSGRAS